MSRDSDLMRAVLRGKTPTNAQFQDYYRAFHADVARATEASLVDFFDQQGRNSYDRLCEAVVEEHPSRVLDVGCGDGPLLARIAERDPSTALSGIDLSPEEIRRARARLATARIGALVVGDASNMPFSNAEFDLVASHMVLMLVPDVAVVLAEIRRVLRKGGSLHIVIPRADEPNGPVAEMLRLLPGWVRDIHPDYSPVNPGDERTWDRDKIGAVLAEMGFSSVECEDFSVERDVNPDASWERIERRYYLGSLPPPTRTYVRERFIERMAGRTMRYREPLRIVHAR